MAFVQGDLHDPKVIEQVGEHEVVFCAGVIYHTPNPMHTLDCLKQMCSGTLIVAGASIPEIPGIPQAAVFYPGLGPGSRAAFNKAFDAARGKPGHRAGLSEQFEPEMSYAAWWWGLTPSALAGMCDAAGFKARRVDTTGFHTRVIADVPPHVP